jgi:uncharacterized protein (TIGR00251 family)
VEGHSVRLTVRAKPRAKTSRILRADGLTIEVSLAAPPVEGAANEELIAVLSKALGVPRRELRLAVGASSKNKVVEVRGLEDGEVARRLAAAARASGS